jgi:hypothetical protein
VHFPAPRTDGLGMRYGWKRPSRVRIPLAPVFRYEIRDIGRSAVEANQAECSVRAKTQLRPNDLATRYDCGVRAPEAARPEPGSPASP